MKNLLLALALALTTLPVAALADDAAAPAAPPAPTAAQRQELEKTFSTFHTQMERLHAQFRTQILNAITPVHRSAVATIIGSLAIAPNPDARAAGQQINALLSPAERNAVTAAHANFRNQVTTLHQQMRAQLQREMPNMPEHGGMHGAMGPGMQGMHGGMMGNQHPTEDAGTILLHVLGGGPAMEFHHGMPMMPMMPPPPGGRQ